MRISKMQAREKALAALFVIVLSLLCYYRGNAQETPGATQTPPEAEKPVAGLTVAQEVHNLRVKKWTRLTLTFEPWAYSPELGEWFITCHEEAGIGDQWFASWTYCMANFGWGIGRTAPGSCFGPCDVKFPYCARPPADVLDGIAWNRHALLNPRVNVWCHVNQMAEYHRKTGREGMALLRTVFYPAAPWGRACNSWAPNWTRWDRKAKASIARAYAYGKLP